MRPREAALPRRSGHAARRDPGPQHCPPDLAHYSYRDKIASVPSPLVTQVEVIMQTKSGGNWSKVDSETVSIEE